MVSYSGSGTSLDDPIVISGAHGHFHAIACEYAYLEEVVGKRGEDWVLETQALHTHEGRYIDSLHIRLKDGETCTYYFDITRYFGMW